MRFHHTSAWINQQGGGERAKKKLLYLSERKIQLSICLEMYSDASMWSNSLRTTMLELGK